MSFFGLDLPEIIEHEFVVNVVRERESEKEREREREARNIRKRQTKCTRFHQTCKESCGKIIKKTSSVKKWRCNICVLDCESDGQGTHKAKIQNYKRNGKDMKTIETNHIKTFSSSSSSSKINSSNRME